MEWKRQHNVNDHSLTMQCKKQQLQSNENKEPARVIHKNRDQTSNWVAEWIIKMGGLWTFEIFSRDFSRDDIFYLIVTVITIHLIWEENKTFEIPPYVWITAAVCDIKVNQ